MPSRSPIVASQQVVLVAGNEIISLASFAHRQQKIIRRIFGTAGCRQSGERLGNSADLIDQPSGLRSPDQGTDPRPRGDGPQLREQQGVGEEDEAVLEPCFEDLAWDTVAADQRADQNVGVQDDPHAARLTVSVVPELRADGGAGFIDHCLDFVAR